MTWTMVVMSSKESQQQCWLTLRTLKMPWCRDWDDRYEFGKWKKDGFKLEIALLCFRSGRRQEFIIFLTRVGSGDKINWYLFFLENDYSMHPLYYALTHPCKAAMRCHACQALTLCMRYPVQYRRDFGDRGTTLSPGQGPAEKGRSI